MLNIEDFLEKDTSYKPQHMPKSRGFFDSLVNALFYKAPTEKDIENRKAYETGVKIGFQIAQQEFVKNLTHPENKDLSEEEYNEILTIIAKLGYRFDYYNPSLYVHNPKHTGLIVRKNIEAYDAGIVVSDRIRKQIVRLVNGEHIEINKKAKEYLRFILQNYDNDISMESYFIDICKKVLKELEEEK